MPECRICRAQRLHRGPNRRDAHLWIPEFMPGVAFYFDHDHGPSREAFLNGIYRLNLICAATGFAMTMSARTFTATDFREHIKSLSNAVAMCLSGR